MARIALISDIHGNGEALRAALIAIGQANCDRIVCLGDLVEGGPENDEVCNILRSRQIPCVLGNHDEDHDVLLTKENEDWIAGLPISIIDRSTIFIHESPAIPPRKIRCEYESWRVFDETNFERVFVGDSHIPALFTDLGMSTGHAIKISFVYDCPVQLRTDCRYIICPGAIGYPRDHLPKPRYAIYDSELQTISFHTLDAPILEL